MKNILLRDGWRILKNRKGMAAIEFAVVAPVMLLLILGTVEITRYIMFIQRVDFTATSLVNILNRNLNVSRADLAAYHRAGRRMMQTSILERNVQFGTTFTAIQQNDPPPANANVLWQVRRGVAVSRIPSGGFYNTTTGLGLPLAHRDQVTVVEVSARFRPLGVTKGLGDVMGFEVDDVYSSAVARPRFGAFQFPPR